MAPGPTTRWKCEEFRDKLTNKLVAVEVSPEFDLQDHISSEDCPCIPELKWQGDISMLVHNAFDGRDTDGRSGH